ncbi:hypothetical protein FQN54_006227 [Arachnomyces sp. PD_36]|nr:hypothetical protein FQN54_006227 [Arachnomyces sp. PD_36]
MGSTPPPKQKQYSVKERQGTSCPGWDTQYFQGSECEYLLDYNEGGLCPVHIDDVFDGSDLIHEGKPCAFRITGKLGRGSYSTVWLARDTTVSTSGKHVALKVLKREHSTLDNPELSILRKLEKLHAAFLHTHAPTRDRFLCFAQQPLGSTLRERVNAEVSAPVDIPSLTAFLKTLLTKMLDFHRRGICHGDISTGNVAFGVHPEAFTKEALDQTFESDLKSNVKITNVSGTPPPLPANLPRYLMMHKESPLKTEAEDMTKVDFIDFGKGFETPSKSNVFGTKNYAAPELDREGENIATVRSDLWSLGCVFPYVLTDTHLLGHGGDKRWYYFEADSESQLSFIESSISTEMLNCDPEYRHTFARLIHSLVQIKPEDRDPQEAMKLVKQLEDLDARRSEAQGNR